MPTPQQRKYANKLKEVIKRYQRLEKATVRQMVDSLQGMKRRISADLLEAQGFEAVHLRMLQGAVGRQIDLFSTGMDANLRGALEQAYRTGGAAAIEPLQAGGIVGLMPHVDIAQLNAVMDFSADLVTAVSEPMRAQINTQLRLAVLGGRSPFQAMRAITELMGIKRGWIVGGVAYRAERILRTEMIRVYNLAQYAQQRRTAREIPGVQKQWMATGDDRTRDSHLAAHGQTVPVNKPFQVGGVRLMFPGDPKAPADQTINCRCTMATIHAEIGPTRTPLDDKVKKERERRRDE